MDIISQIALQQWAILAEATGFAKGEIKKLRNISVKFQNKDKKPAPKTADAFNSIKSDIIKLCNKGIKSTNIKKGLTAQLTSIRDTLKNKTAVKEFRKYLKSNV